MEDMRIENERLRSERKILADGENHERQTGEQRGKEWSDEKVSSAAFAKHTS